MNVINKKAAYIGCLGLIGILSTEFGIVGILPQIADYYSIRIDDTGYLLSAFALIIASTGPFIVLNTANFDRRNLQKEFNVACYSPICVEQFPIGFSTALLVAGSTSNFARIPTTGICIHSSIHCHRRCNGENAASLNEYPNWWYCNSPSNRNTIFNLYSWNLWMAVVICNSGNHQPDYNG